MEYSVHDNKLVSPSTGITFTRVYHSKFHAYSPETVTETNTETETEIDTNMLTKVLDHGHGYSDGFDSADFVLFNHSQRILVVTND